MSELRRWAAIAACVLGSGCIPTLVENPAREVSKAVPKSFRQGDEATSDETVGKKNWKDFFASPELQGLISTALQNNQELNVRLQEIIIAQTEIAARRGEYLPKLKAGLGTGIEKVGGYTSQGFSDKATGVPENLGNFGFGLQASWEIDVWGKLRNAAQSADFRYQASVGGKNFMVTQLVAEIARSYYELIALDNQLEVLKRNIKIQQDALEVVKIEKQAARVTQLAVQRFEAEVLKNRSRLYDLEQERVQAENRINFLVGRYPQPVARSPDAMKDPLPAVLAAGLPSQLLENRPDVRGAAFVLRSRAAELGEARADMFPKFYLTFLGEDGHMRAPDLPMAGGIFQMIGLGMRLPIFNAGRLRAKIAVQDARLDAAAAEYERSILQALEDVESVYVARLALDTRTTRLNRAVTLADESAQQSEKLYKAGQELLQPVLESYGKALQREDELVQARTARATTTVTLYKAIGAGWSADGTSAALATLYATSSAQEQPKAQQEQPQAQVQAQPQTAQATPVLASATAPVPAPTPAPASVPVAAASAATAPAPVATPAPAPTPKPAPAPTPTPAPAANAPAPRQVVVTATASGPVIVSGTRRTIPLNAAPAALPQRTEFDPPEVLVSPAASHR